MSEMRELTLSEIREVAGGTGFAAVSASAESGANSELIATVSGTLETTNNFAFASVSARTVSVIGTNNVLSTSATAEVF